MKVLEEDQETAMKIFRIRGDALAMIEMKKLLSHGQLVSSAGFINITEWEYR